MNILNRRSTIFLLIVPCLLLSPGCTTVKPGPDFLRVQELVEQSTGFPDTYNPEEPMISHDEIIALLADGLSIDEASRIALLNNRRLQAQFMSIGVAKADWVQSGLLSNPSLDMLLRFPVDGGRSQIEGLFLQNILELWRIPLRKELAQHKLDDTVFTIARIASDLVAETRTTYYQALAADELQLLAERNLENATQGYQAVRNLREGGVATIFDENLARGPLLEAQVSLRSRQLEARDARRRIATLLSIDLDVNTLILLDSLPDPAVPQYDVDSLIEIAMDARLDLRAYQAAMDAAGVSINYESRNALGELSIGVSVERPPVTGETIVGPAISATIPIFDQNQAQIARAEYQFVQAVKSFEAIQLKVTQDIRSIADHASTVTLTLAFYESELLPQVEQNLEMATTAYSSGQASLVALLEAQRTYLEAKTGYIQSRQESAAAMLRLEQAVGKPLKQIE